ncbi:hypothetical protein [Flammeovirga sp. SJP92]|uniref:hypothetical protein n=1 Tax=Flammeovirga sp. SJP92 TaxID=1775430 RepID=UPI000788DC8B|nr:hypothetical protein [Flammeovirga sp. SJP92]KXX69119.1 hypothetical protein AVL50_16915 [Flammeovirga sp. SJP92]
MKNFLILVICVLTLSSVIAQEKGTYQADSIYKTNNVKLRKWYMGTNKKLGVITYYDKEGRLTKYQVKMNLGATDKTTHYQYGSNGQLESIVDSIKYGEPDKKEIKSLKKMGINPNMLLGDINNKPQLEVSKYDLVYESDELIKITKYNPDGTLDFIDNFKNNGKIQERALYRNGELYRISFTEYLIPNHKAKFYGWEMSSGKKSEWNYSFEYELENGLVKSYARFDNGKEMETVEYFYDDNGLLLKTKGNILEQFEYQFYE